MLTVSKIHFACQGKFAVVMMAIMSVIRNCNCDNEKRERNRKCVPSSTDESLALVLISGTCEIVRTEINYIFSSHILFIELQLHANNDFYICQFNRARIIFFLAIPNRYHPTCSESYISDEKSFFGTLSVTEFFIFKLNKTILLVLCLKRKKIKCFKILKVKFWVQIKNVE